MREMTGQYGRPTGKGQTSEAHLSTHHTHTKTHTLGAHTRMHTLYTHARTQYAHTYLLINNYTYPYTVTKRGHAECTKSANTASDQATQGHPIDDHITTSTNTTTRAPSNRDKHQNRRRCPPLHVQAPSLPHITSYHITTGYLAALRVRLDPPSLWLSCGN